MKLKNLLLSVMFCSLVTLNLLLPKMLLGQTCCKDCAWGSQVTETTRAATCSICYVTVCTVKFDTSPNCAGGTFMCDTANNDSCNFPIECN